jgi:hypothetical protein|tara:strand:- start:1502 stop:1678 length:177 start_codon:yes stop_codon:yes gene_type:complete
MTRNERVALHKTQQRTQIKTGKPSAGELTEGVSTIRNVAGKGAVEYVKVKNIVHKKKI